MTRAFGARQKIRTGGAPWGARLRSVFHAGAVAQAPPALQRCGLEWLFRLYCEPKRLWRRYAYSNPMFVMLFGWQWLRYHMRRLVGQPQPFTVQPGEAR